MPNPLLWPVARKVGTQLLKQTVFPKTLNEHEDLVVKEMSNKNSPMHKDVSKWTDSDLNKALSSPSFKYNYTLQNKARQYIKRK